MWIVLKTLTNFFNSISSLAAALQGLLEAIASLAAQATIKHIPLFEAIAKIF